MKYVEEEYELLRKGDLSAFSLIYEKFKPILLGFIRRYVPDRQEAENISQAIFMDCWRRYQQVINKTDNIEAWLVQCAKNQIASYLKTKQIEEQRIRFICKEDIVLLERYGRIKSKDISSSNPRKDNQKIALLQWANLLHEEDKKIVQLILEGWKLPEIAKSIQVEPKNIARRFKWIIGRLIRARHAKTIPVVRLLIQVVPEFQGLSNQKMLMTLYSVDEAICSLPNESKRIIQLYLTGISYTAMAKEMNCSATTTKRRFVQAIQELQTIIQK